MPDKINTALYPSSIKPAVGIIVFDAKKTKILLVKRADNKLWAIPTGKIEPCETITVACMRELYEETGLKGTVKRLIGIYSEPDSQIFIAQNGEITHYVTLCFECEVFTENPVADGTEILHADFFALNHLPKDLFPMHPQWLEDALQDNQEVFIR